MPSQTRVHAITALGDPSSHGASQTSLGCQDVPNQQTSRAQVCYGSLNEVRRFEEYLYGKSERFGEAKAEAKAEA